MKKQPKVKFYSLDRIKKERATYNVIFGERSNGKTYAVQKEIIENYWQNHKQGAIVRRWMEDFRSKRGATMFDGLCANGEVERITGGVWTGVYYQGLRWYLARVTEDGQREVDETPFAYGFSIASMEHDKSTSYPNVTLVMFDEFLTRSAYLPDEFLLFMNVLSTIVRQRDDVVIYMLGNAVNKYSPYFSEMGLDHVKDMKPGSIDLYRYGDSGLTVAVEFSDSPCKEGKASDKYFAFNNPSLSMITGQNGIWEIALYPHIPLKYKKENVRFTYFIQFNGDTVQCNVVDVNGCMFTAIHKKTTEIKYPEKDIVFSPNADPRPNWRTRMIPPKNRGEQYLYSFFLRDKVFYQDNETGEIVRNYLQWCGKR